MGRVSIFTEYAGEAVPFPQVFHGITLIIPDTAVSEKLTVTDVVLSPDPIEAPEGRFQKYLVALATEAREKATPVVPWQTLSVPVSAPAKPGRGLAATAKEGETVPYPQEFFPYTVIFPDDAEGEKFTVMELVRYPETMVVPGERTHE